jgi:transmembrane sensor
MDQSRLQYLMQRYCDNTATPAELQELSDYIRQSPEDDLFAAVMQEQLQQHALYGIELKRYEQIADQVIEAGKRRRSEEDSPQPEIRRIPKWIWAAACLLLVASAVFYFLREQPGTTRIIKTVTTPPQQIPPGKNGAILTLADGTTVLLDSLGNGKIASQQGTDVVIKAGSLRYANADKNNREVAYNTLSTPRGRQFQILLSDGTAVWLNAASSIRYPVVFSDTQRVVEIIGEAYFEVATRRLPAKGGGGKKIPFKVIIPSQPGGIGGATIEVLGTHFNVNAYSNEPAVKTTLIEGAVRVTQNAERETLNAKPVTQKAKREIILKPGEQAIAASHSPRHGGHALTIDHSPDLEKVMAWKNGVFDFTDETLQDVMKQLERWYDIDVQYEKHIPAIRFYGKMTKHISLNDLLIILEKSKVHFQIEGRTLIVKP